MNRHKLSQGLIVAGSCAFVAGILDPLEGSLVILAGSGMVAFGSGIDPEERAHAPFWTAVFAAMLIGVCALFVLSAQGGFGGDSGHSRWWGLTIVPYPLAWIAGLYLIVARVVEYFKQRHVII
jgi:hypothetical protein